jgi:glycine/D-amino acid oxidase-like deaminating enzyme
MNTISLWRGVQGEALIYPKLDRNFEVDVAIVGAGITGITAALQLIRAGKRVAILEAGEIGKGTTGDSTGNLYVAVQPYYYFIKSKFGGEAAKAIAQSRAFSIDFMEALVKEKNIDCFFHRRPWYLYSKDHKNDGIIDREVKALKEAGMCIQLVDAIPLPVKISKAALQL